MHTRSPNKHFIASIRPDNLRTLEAYIIKHPIANRITTPSATTETAGATYVREDQHGPTHVQPAVVVSLVSSYST